MHPPRVGGSRQGSGTPPPSPSGIASAKAASPDKKRRRGAALYSIAKLCACLSVTHSKDSRDFARYSSAVTGRGRRGGWRHYGQLGRRRCTTPPAVSRRQRRDAGRRRAIKSLPASPLACTPSATPLDPSVPAFDSFETHCANVKLYCFGVRPRPGSWWSPRLTGRCTLRAAAKGEPRCPAGVYSVVRNQRRHSSSPPLRRTPAFCAPMPFGIARR